jgi:hypothetical protein
MPLFGRKPKPPRPPSVEMPAGEEIERSTKATLLYGKEALKGALYLTNKRLMFEAEKGDTRWMIVPFAEMKSVGLYPWPGATMGMPSSRQQCLVVETTKGEQVWWDFGEKEEREWQPLVQARVTAPSTDDTDDDQDGSSGR